MSKDKYPGEREKLEAEIARSLSVVKMKEAHKQIEDIEKLRRQASIKSICKRISSCFSTTQTVMKEMVNAHKENPNIKLDWEIKEGKGGNLIKQYLDQIMKIYESICFDIQKNIDIKKEDFDRLFPKIEFDLSTFGTILSFLGCLSMQLIDMRDYCQRLL